MSVQTTSRDDGPSGDEILAEFVESDEYLSERSVAGSLFLENAEVVAHAFENCRCREEFALRREASVSSGTEPVPACDGLSESAIHPDDRYDWDLVPEVPREKTVDLFEDRGRETCSSCGGDRTEPCSCGNGREVCSECGGSNTIPCSCDDGRVPCPKCEGDGEIRCCPKDDTCAWCDWNGMKPCDRDGCENGTIPCSQPNCDGGELPCSCPYDGEVRCSTCGGSGEIDCSHCEGIGERVAGRFGELSFTVSTEATQVESDEGMPADAVAANRPESATAYDYADVDSYEDVDDGIVKRGTRTWNVPCHRVRYTYDGETYTVLKIGDEFQSTSLPDGVFEPERQTYRSGLTLHVGLFAAFVGYVTLVDPNPTGVPVSVLFGLVLGLGVGLAHNAVSGMEEGVQSTGLLTTVAVILPAATIATVAAPNVLAQASRSPPRTSGPVVAVSLAAVTLLLVTITHLGSVRLTAPHEIFEDSGPNFVLTLLGAVGVGSAIGIAVAPFEQITYYGTLAIWSIGGAVSLFFTLGDDD